MNNLLLHSPYTKNLSRKSALIATTAVLFLLSTLAQASFAAFAATSVSSGGMDEPYIVQQVASASNPSKVYQITGAQIAQRLVGSAYKNYLYLYINTASSFAVNTTGLVTKTTVTGYDTNNLYWNAQSPPSSSGRSSFCGTVGQDLDLGATSNTLSEWQWADLNWGCGSRVSYSGSYDGGGPSACYTFSNNQERESIYVIIVDSSTKAIYWVTGAVLIQQKVNGVASSTLVELVSGSQGKLVTSGDQKDCTLVSNPMASPSLRWYVRTPPVQGKIPGVTIVGNFGIVGTLGEGVTKEAANGNMIFEQFIDRTMQTGYIPNRGAPTDISMLMSTDPVSGATAPWPA